MRLPKRSPIQLARNDVTRMGKYCACGVSDYTAETVQGAPAHKDGADETERAVRGRVEELEPLGVSLHGVEEGSWRVQYKFFFFWVCRSDHGLASLLLNSPSYPQV